MPLFLLASEALNQLIHKVSWEAFGLLQNGVNLVWRYTTLLKTLFQFLDLMVAESVR